MSSANGKLIFEVSLAGWLLYCAFDLDSVAVSVLPFFYTTQVTRVGGLTVGVFVSLHPATTFCIWEWYKNLDKEKKEKEKKARSRFRQCD